MLGPRAAALELSPRLHDQGRSARPAVSSPLGPHCELQGRRLLRAEKGDRPRRRFMRALASGASPCGWAGLTPGPQQNSSSSTRGSWRESLREPASALEVRPCEVQKRVYRAVDFAREFIVIALVVDVVDGAKHGRVSPVDLAGRELFDVQID